MRLSISFCNEAGSLVTSFPEDCDRKLERFDDIHQLSSHRFERWSGSFKNSASELPESRVSLSLVSLAVALLSRSWWRRPRLHSHCGLVRLPVRPDGLCNDLFQQCFACFFVFIARATSPVSADAVLHVVAAFIIIASFPSFAALHHRLLHVVLLTITTLAISRETESRVSLW